MRVNEFALLKRGNLELIKRRLFTKLSKEIYQGYRKGLKRGFKKIIQGVKQCSRNIMKIKFKF